MKQDTALNYRNTREWKERLHRRLVLAQLAGVGVSICLMDVSGFGAWTLATLAVTVGLMLISAGLRLGWRRQDLGGPRASGERATAYPTAGAHARVEQHPVIAVLLSGNRS